MLRGLPASIILHGAVVFGGAVAWPYIAPERTVEEVFIPLTIDMQLDLTTNIAPIVSRKVEPEDELEIPESQEPEEVDEESEDVEITEDELDTTDVREQQDARAEPEANEEATNTNDAAEPDVPDNSSNTAPDTFENFMNQNAELFNNETKRSRPPPKRPKKIELKDETLVSSPQVGVGDPSRSTNRVVDIITNKLKTECWRGVQDLPEPERLVVTVRIQLTIDGKLDGKPELLRPISGVGNDKFMRTAIQRALGAARRCEYRLPEGAEQTYEEWKTVKIKFDINS